MLTIIARNDQNIKKGSNKILPCSRQSYSSTNTEHKCHKMHAIAQLSFNLKL